MKTAFLFLSFTLANLLAGAQEYKKQFSALLQKGDTTEQLKLLQTWEKQEPKSPELFTSYFNYYVSKAKKSMLEIQSYPTQEDAVVIEDSTGKAVGFIGDGTWYHPDTLQLGLDKINEGIALYPDRLDMRLGKVYMFKETKNWKALTDEIIKTVERSAQNNNNWTWTFNEKKEDGEAFFLGTIQHYQLALYNTQNDSLLLNMRRIATKVIEHYPSHVESLTNLSLSYIILGNYKPGLEPLLKAEKINPDDAIVLLNIARCYRLMEDFENAIKYYEKAALKGDPQMKAYAEQQVKELKSDLSK